MIRFAIDRLTKERLGLFRFAFTLGASAQIIEQIGIIWTQFQRGVKMLPGFEISSTPKRPLAIGRVPDPGAVHLHPRRHTAADGQQQQSGAASHDSLRISE